MKKILNILLTTFICVVSLCSPVFAEDDPNSKTVPIKLSATASSTTIDVGVTETINVTCDAEKTSLVYDEFEIMNYSGLGQVSLDGLTITPQNGWEIVADSTAFESLEKNSKKFSFVLDPEGETTDGYDGEEFDFSTNNGAMTLTHGDVLIDINEESIVLNFKGQIGIQTQEIDDVAIANLVVTLSIY